jgi:hypothetical protein
MLLLPALLLAHVTPNVQLLKTGDFLKQALLGATSFFERRIPLKALEGKAFSGPVSEESARLYVGRGVGGRLIGSVVFLWVPSRHGPVRIGVSFDAEGFVRQAVVTDVASEALACVRPLLAAGAMEGFQGLSADASLRPETVAPQVIGSMSRYYAKVLAEGVARAMAIEKAAREPRKP